MGKDVWKFLIAGGKGGDSVVTTLPRLFGKGRRGEIGKTQLPLLVTLLPIRPEFKASQAANEQKEAKKTFRFSPLLHCHSGMMPGRQSKFLFLGHFSLASCTPPFVSESCVAGPY